MKLNTKYFTDQKITNMKFGTKSPGLGDTLLLTSVCKYFPNQFTIQLDENKSRVSCLFSSLANVELVKNEEINELGDIGSGHYATRKLRNFFGEVAEKLDNRPLVLYSDYESERWAFNYLQDKQKPVIVVPTCSKQWHLDRSMPKDLFDNAIARCKELGFTPIVCQSSSNFMDHSEISLVDCEIAKYICLLRMSKEYVGANTGDEHLATALGCKTTVFQPSYSDSFNRFEWNYSHPNSNYFFWH